MTGWAKDEDMEGSVYKRMGPITIACISPEARDLLETIMAEFEKHKKEFHNLFPGKRITIYGFAYWLVRHSGLIEAQRPNK
jgi:hypothetical protein